MDVSKYPLEKIFYFAAGVIPGFVALVIFNQAHPQAFLWFFGMGFVGYKTKVALILITAFTIGNSILAFMEGFLYLVGHLVGRWHGKNKPYVPPHTLATAPWRDQRWRTVLSNCLGAKSPADSNLLTEATLNIYRQMAEKLQPLERQARLITLEQQRLTAELNDSRWAQWYDHYHQLVLTEEWNSDFATLVRNGLHSNLWAAAVFVLASAIWVPSVRQWWCILPAFGWVLILAARTYGTITRYLNSWSTLTSQIKYLAASNAGKLDLEMNNAEGRVRS
jgi:hypothetical protein